MKNLVPNASDEALEVLKKMFKINPNKRATAASLLQDPYFRNCNIKQMIIQIKNMSPNVKNFEVK